MEHAFWLGFPLMTHGQGVLWWAGFFAANWLTAAAYFAIPIRMRMQRRRGQRGAESLLFEFFILSCGVHHALMAPGMLFGFLPLVLTADATMALISVFAAVELTRQPPFEQAT